MRHKSMNIFSCKIFNLRGQYLMLTEDLLQVIITSSSSCSHCPELYLISSGSHILVPRLSAAPPTLPLVLLTELAHRVSEIKTLQRQCCTGSAALKSSLLQFEARVQRGWGIFLKSKQYFIALSPPTGV